MTDLSALIDDLCEGLGGDPASNFPGFPGSFPGGKTSQAPDQKQFSRSSRFSRSENRGFKSEIEASPESPDFSTSAHARTNSDVGEPGKPGKPGNREKSLAETISLPFPVNFLEPGKPGNQEPVAGVFPPPGDSLPIGSDDVRAGVARELRSLAEDGREGPDALRDAIEITRAKIRNSEALAEHQANGAACHVCDGPLDDSLPVVAVLSGKPGRALHMHAECCGTYTTRRIALVGRIMAAAGYAEFLSATTHEEASI